MNTVCVNLDCNKMCNKKIIAGKEYPMNQSYANLKEECADVNVFQKAGFPKEYADLLEESCIERGIHPNTLLKEIKDFAEKKASEKAEKKVSHKDCRGVRGVKYFRCIHCGRQATRYANGVDICAECCSVQNLCNICGKEK